MSGWQDPTGEYPVLAEVPELAGMLDDVLQVDRLIAGVIDSIIRLQDADVAETATGVPLEQWLLIVARRTGSDRRMLLAAAETCRRLPALHTAFSQGQLSWSQVRTLVLQVMRLPRATDHQLDTALTELIGRCEGHDPDTLGQLARFLDHDHPTPDRHTDGDSGERVGFLALQPCVDGTGGRFFGEAGPAEFAILENATNPGPPPVATGRHFGAAADPDTAQRVADTAGRRRLARLIDRLDTDAEAGGVGDDTDGEPAGRSVPTLLVAADLDTLCDRTRTPGRLLHHLAGGRMLLSAAATRRLIDERGADLRTIVLDDTGAVVGIGRRHRVPPGALADAVLALHDTCSEPGCNVAARSCQLDHARPWHPTRPDQVLGRSDVDNLGPLCTSANRTKDTDGWSCTQTAAGTRRWRHARTGLTVTTTPTGRRPPWLDPPPAGPGPDASDGTDPPGDPPGPALPF